MTTISKNRARRENREDTSTSFFSEGVAEDRATRIAFYFFMAAVGASLIMFLVLPFFIG